MGITGAVNSQTNGNRSINFSIFTPRIWKIMIVVAYPSLLLVTDYFEALERTGIIGAFIADTLMPVTMISYVAFIFVLKKRAI